MSRSRSKKRRGNQSRLTGRVEPRMAWLDLKHVRYLFGLLWRGVCFFTHGILKVIPLPFIVGKRFLLAIGGAKTCGSQNDPDPESTISGEHPQNKQERNDVPSPQCESTNKAEASVSCPNSDQSYGEFDSEDYRVDITDDLYCGYDSTWETTEEKGSTPKKSRRSAGSRNYKFARFERAAQDMQNYRHDYPSLRQKTASVNKPNLSFYRGEQYSQPDGVSIFEFHKEWKGKYDDLEIVHSYIQWLFPLPEPGMNSLASTLTKQEILDFNTDDIAKKNLLESYKLMLDFYGIELCDENTGEVKRAANWEERFNNLNYHTHNNLRITRILKCLGILGYVHYQAPLVQFFLEETLVNGQLPSVKESALSYFVFAVREKTIRRKLLKFAYLHYEPKCDFVWCPTKIQNVWAKKATV